MGRPGHHGKVSQHVTLPRLANLHEHPRLIIFWFSCLGSGTCCHCWPRRWFESEDAPEASGCGCCFAQVGRVWVAFQSGGKPLCYLAMTLSDHWHAVCPTRPVSSNTCSLSTAKAQTTKSERQRGHVMCVLATHGKVNLDYSVQTLPQTCIVETSIFCHCFH